MITKRPALTNQHVVGACGETDHKISFIRRTDNINAFSNYQSSPQSAASNQIQMSDVMRGLWVGPMPVKQFLHDFLPITDKAGPALPLTYFDAMPDTKIEKEMYQPFVRSLVILWDVLYSLVLSRLT